MKSCTDSSLRLISAPTIEPFDFDHWSSAEEYWTHLMQPRSSISVPDRLVSDEQAFISIWDKFAETQTVSLQARFGAESSLTLASKIDGERNPLEVKSTLDFIQQRKIGVQLSLSGCGEKICAIFDLAKGGTVFRLEVTPDEDKTPTQQISKILRELAKRDLAAQKLSLVINWENHPNTSISAADIPHLSSEKLFFDSQKRPVPVTARITSFELQMAARMPRTLAMTFEKFQVDSEEFLNLAYDIANSLFHASNKDSQTELDPIEQAKQRLLDSMPSTGKKA